MTTIPDINKAISCQILPSTWVTIRVLIVEKRLIPALSQVMGTIDDNEETTFGAFIPLRALFVTQNPDGTYAVLNDLRTISPEASHSTADYIITFLIEFDPDRPEDEAIVRTLLALIEPVRQTRTIQQYIKDAQRGAFDAIAPLYAGNRVNPRKRVAASSMLPTGQLARSTFQRIYKALLAPKRKPKAKGSNETGLGESAATNAINSQNQQQHTQKEDRQLVERPGVQGELF
ncbi:MAG: hypothetical protein KZQ96_20780 [Candidatus Thiodiazotropha sp. (ex Lucinoma borealis)]|nr:hypothetical protein [Candidatus Thiodiazotropha sp. (ex Lucinoma borealis)]